MAAELTRSDSLRSDRAIHFPGRIDLTTDLVRRAGGTGRHGAKTANNQGTENLAGERRTGAHGGGCHLFVRSKANLP